MKTNSLTEDAKWLYHAIRFFFLERTIPLSDQRDLIFMVVRYQYYHQLAHLPEKDLWARTQRQRAAPHALASQQYIIRYVKHAFPQTHVSILNRLFGRGNWKNIYDY